MSKVTPFSACPMQSIGVRGIDAFPDSSFSASTSRAGNDAFKGRLYYAGAWSPSRNDNPEDYLQIDLLYEFVICAVATRGRKNMQHIHWTTKYMLQLSYSGSNWVTYQENNADKVGLRNSEMSANVSASLESSHLYKS